VLGGSFVSPQIYRTWM